MPDLQSGETRVEHCGARSESVLSRKPAAGAGENTFKNIQSF